MVLSPIESAITFILYSINPCGQMTPNLTYIIYNMFTTILYIWDFCNWITLRFMAL